MSGQKRRVAANAKWPEIERLAKTRAPEAIQVLSEIMLDTDQAGATRVSAANAILDRGYGKPKSRVDVSGNIDVNAAHLHAIKTLASQVTNEARSIKQKDGERHEITIEHVPMSKADMARDVKPSVRTRKTWERNGSGPRPVLDNGPGSGPRAADNSIPAPDTPDIFR